MRYKALFSDVDGTLIPYDYDALPSDAVVAAIKKAQDTIHLCLITGRSLGFTKPVLKRLGLHSGYVVVNGGAQVFDLSTNTELYCQTISKENGEFITNILNEEHMTYFVKQEILNQNYDSTSYIAHPFQKGDTLGNSYMIFVEENYSKDTIDQVSKRLSVLPDIVLHVGNHKHPDKFGLNITHVKATKLHGVEVVTKKLGVTSDECIGMGDGYNDFPLLMACGLKIAMGNAVKELKEIADFVAPSVDEDGAVTVIEKFIFDES